MRFSIKNAFVLYYAMVLLITAIGCSAEGPEQSARRPAPKGDYFGLVPPGETPVLFAPGVVSTGMDELNAVFSPDGRSFLFSVKMPGRMHHSLLEMRRTGNDWSAPEVLPFSGVYGDADPSFDRDGTRVFFISTRPVPPGSEPKKDWDIWAVVRTEKRWGEPWNLGAPVNTDKLEVYPSVTDGGTLYFSSGRDGGLGKNDIYRSRLVNGRYTEPENLGGAVNSEDSEGDLYIAPDESYIVFVSSGREGGYGGGDLYISFHTPGGGWSEALNMGDAINTKYTEYCPAVTRDGKYLFFTSYNKPETDYSENPLTYKDIKRSYQQPQTGLGDIYWMDAGIIAKLKTRSLE